MEMKLPKTETKRRLARQWPRVSCALFLLVLVSLLAGCAAKSQSRDAARHHLAGKIVSVDTVQGILLVDHQAIPGFMDAMTMPYPVPDAAALAALTPGDEITADVVVTPAGGHLENIVVTRKAPPGAAPAAARMHEPEPGDRVPDFTVTNHDGKRTRLSAFRGHVLLVTFIYTRCPFPDYCPLVSRNFAQIYAATRAQRAPEPDIRLLSVSLDPAHDTPAVLRNYASTFRQVTGGSPFDRWEFAAAPPDELKKMADFFGLYINSENGTIIHSMSTTVISPEGVVYKWFGDNDWTPADLIAVAAQASKAQAADTAASRAAAAVPKS